MKPTTSQYVKMKELDPLGGGGAGGAPWIRQCSTQLIIIFHGYFEGKHPKDLDSKSISLNRLRKIMAHYMPIYNIMYFT